MGSVCWVQSLIYISHIYMFLWVQCLNIPISWIHYHAVLSFFNGLTKQRTSLMQKHYHAVLPCFNGLTKQRTSLIQKHYHAVLPCFNGLTKQRTSLMQKHYHAVSPCFNGLTKQGTSLTQNWVIPDCIVIKCKCRIYCNIVAMHSCFPAYLLLTYTI